MIDKKDISFCKRINKKYGKSYYFATQFFPKDLRETTYVLYAFYRLPDEIVDNQKENPEKELDQYINDWRDAIDKKETNNPVLRATLKVHEKYKIPFDYSISFLEAMKRDLNQNRYKDFEELNEYIYGSASCVGFMMIYLIGFNQIKKYEVLQYAEHLAIAMQITNFLRDIKEDFDRGRIYMPLDELEKYKLSESDIKNKKISPDFIEFMKFQTNRCRTYYRSAEIDGIPLLDKHGRLAVLLASKLYSEILNEIEKQNYDIFTKRAKVSFIKKIIILCKTIIKK